MAYIVGFAHAHPATKNFADSIPRTATSFEPIVHVSINLLFQLWINRHPC
jgi:hypothetical protein